MARLDLPGTAAAFRADPDAALRRAARPLLIDEWQELPEVLGAVRRAVDADHRPGQFILTGSVRAELSSQTWAGTGRVVRMSMYGLIEREVTGELHPSRPSFAERLATSGLDDLRLPEVRQRPTTSCSPTSTPSRWSRRGQSPEWAIHFTAGSHP